MNYEHNHPTHAIKIPKVFEPFVNFKISGLKLKKKVEKKKVLIADDDEMTLAMVNLYLTNQGFEVMPARDSYEVIKYIKDFKPDFFDNTPINTAYDAVAPDKTKWRKFLEQMFAFAKVPFNVGDSNISKIAAPVLIISGDNDGLDKVELMKTYRLLGGGVSADLQPMPKSQLAIVPSQGHVSLMMETTTILNYLNSFLK